MAGFLIAFEGLDQSGKQTQAELLRDRLKQDGRKARLVSFPDYGTSIGEEIARALAGEREYGPDVMQLLYVANRYERKPDLERWLEGGLILVCDRYTASSVAYGEAAGLDPEWLTDMQTLLPPAARLHNGLSSAPIASGRSLACPSSQHRASWLSSSARATQRPNTPACENTVSPTIAIAPCSAIRRAYVPPGASAPYRLRQRSGNVLGAATPGTSSNACAPAAVT